MTSAADFVHQDVEWLLNDFVPYGCITLLVGQQGVGKSTFMAWLAANCDGNVLWFGAEEHPVTMTRPKLMAAEAPLALVTHPGYDKAGGIVRHWQFPGDGERLSSLIASKSAVLVVFDPLTSFLPPSFEVNGTQQVRTLMELLGGIAARHQCAMVVTLHLRKSRDGSCLDWVSGSAAWTQTARIVLALGKHPETDEQMVLACAKNNLGPLPDSYQYRLEPSKWDNVKALRFVLGKECKIGAEQLAPVEESNGERDALADAKEFLRLELKDEERTVADIEKAAEAAGIRPRTLRRAKQELKITSHPVGNIGNRYWVWRKPTGGFPQLFF